MNSQDKTQPIPAIEPPAVPCQRKRIQGFRGPGMNPGHVWCHGDRGVIPGITSTHHLDGLLGLVVSQVA